jgi:hypothetical protein
VQQEDPEFDTPILFLIFNRPDLTEKVFGQIRKIRPKQLFIGADGPRKDKLGEDEKCQETRQLVLDMIDWDCEVKTLFREENLGCGLAVSQAITWFFEHVEIGIILEDDCYPHLSFFEFCEKMLDYYKEDEEVMHISGGSYLPPKHFNKDTYYFSKYPFVWGWATWQNAWNKYDFNIQESHDFIEKVHSSKHEQKYWQNIYKNIKNGKLDTWDWIWNFTLWNHRGISLNSTRNRIKNIGFNSSATHTKSPSWIYAKIPFAKETKLIVNHPSHKKINKQADQLVFSYYNLGAIPFFVKFKNWIYGRL